MAPSASMNDELSSPSHIMQDVADFVTMHPAYTVRALALAKARTDSPPSPTPSRIPPRTQPCFPCPYGSSACPADQTQKASAQGQSRTPSVRAPCCSAYSSAHTAAGAAVTGICLLPPPPPSALTCNPGAYNLKHAAACNATSKPLHIRFTG